MRRTYSKIVYIYSKQRKISYSFFTLVIFFWVLLDQTSDKFSSIFPHMDFWMIELIIITFLTAKIFKMNIYKHQYFVIFFNLFPIILKVITIYLSFKETSKNDKSKYLDEDGNLKYIYIVYWFLLIIGMIIYLPLITLRAYVNIQLKYFMDLKFVPPNILLLIYGIIGTIFYSGICIFSTFIKCDSSKEINIFDYICKFKEKDDKYFENFIFYFSISKNPKDIIFEILTIILGIIGFYFNKYFMILSLNYLTPVHIMFIIPIFFFFINYLV